jgi:hypothetical protein
MSPTYEYGKSGDTRLLHNRARAVADFARPSQTPKERPMISFMISVVPP